MKEGRSELRGHLKGTLKELDRLADQIRQTNDYSDSAELFLCLKELVGEQIEVSPLEDTCSSAHAIR